MRRLVLLIAVSPLVALADASEGDAPRGVPTCCAVVSCVAAGCVPLPTSLVPIDCSIPSTEWWEPGGKCGTKRCYVIFRCPCGPRLTTAACL